MKRLINDKLNEAVISIIPIMIIMLLISFILDFNLVTIISILISTLLLILGITMFSLGADLSMMEIGKTISLGLLQSKKLSLILIVSLIVGTLITIAEPDLKVLSSQMTAIDSNILVWAISLGTGLFLIIAVLRILYQIKLKKIIFICYTILLGLMLLSKNEMIPLAFDSGGVTVGPMTVPFILALGIGFSASRSRKNSNNDSFGLISLCSIGPILTVLILGLFINEELTYTYNIVPLVTDYFELVRNYFNEIIPVFKEVLISLLPILLIYIVFIIITKKILIHKLIKVLVGSIIIILGLTLFLIGVNIGYLPIAYNIGINLYNNTPYLLIPIGLIIGFVIVKAEPSIAVLTEQIEKLTGGSIKRNIMNNTIAVGVSLAVIISIIRVITGISINMFILIGYLIALILMKYTPEIFTMVAFDSGGAVTGPMTSSFLLPLIIGICYASGGNVLTDAFGIVALVALSPLITIQLLGIIYKQKSIIKTVLTDIDESIIEFRKEVSNG